LQRKVSGFRGPFALYGRAEHRRQIAPQFDSERPVGWRHDDGVDQASERLGRLRARFYGLERVSQRRHLLAVQLGHLRVQEWRRLVS